MTTRTSKTVARVTEGVFSSRIIGHTPRQIEVKIVPDTLILRLYGTQQREYLSIKDAFEIARSQRVRSERMMKVNFNKRSKK